MVAEIRDERNFLSFSHTFTLAKRELGLNMSTTHPKNSKHQESETIDKNKLQISKEKKKHRIEERVRVRDLDRLIELREDIGGELRQEARQRRESRLRVLGTNSFHSSKPPPFYSTDEFDKTLEPPPPPLHHCHVDTIDATPPPGRQQEGFTCFYANPI